MHSPPLSLTTSLEMLVLKSFDAVNVVSMARLQDAHILKQIRSQELYQSLKAPSLAFDVALRLFVCVYKCVFHLVFVNAYAYVWMCMHVFVLHMMQVSLSSLVALCLCSCVYVYTFAYACISMARILLQQCPAHDVYMCGCVCTYVYIIRRLPNPAVLAMYVKMYAYMHIHVKNQKIAQHPPSLHCMYVCMYVCMQVCAYVCIHINNHEMAMRGHNTYIIRELVSGRRQR
jgi:hypothetical protein